MSNNFLFCNKSICKIIRKGVIIDTENRALNIKVIAKEDIIRSNRGKNSDTLSNSASFACGFTEMCRDDQ